MVAIRLTRMGAKKKPFYRVVVVDQGKTSGNGLHRISGPI